MKLVMGGEEPKKPPKNQTKDTAFTMYLILVGDKVRRRMNFDPFVEVVCAFSPEKSRSSVVKSQRISSPTDLWRIFLNFGDLFVVQAPYRQLESLQVKFSTFEDLSQSLLVTML